MKPGKFHRKGAALEMPIHADSVVRAQLSRRSVLAGTTAVLASALSMAHRRAAANNQTTTSVRDPDTVQTAEHLEFKVPYTVHYLAYLPEGYARSRRQKWPLMVFLHGAGERGTDLELVKLHGPPKLIAAGKSFPFIVISPQCPPNQGWNSIALEGLFDQLQRRYRIDAKRFYLTGLSMGGFATWDLAVRHPERYAAIAPICGSGDPSRASALRNVPVWAFHGARDDVVSLKGSQEMVAAIEAAGGTPRFTVYPEAGHDSWTETYANEELYSWLLQQKLPHGS